MDLAQAGAQSLRERTMDPQNLVSEGRMQLHGSEGANLCELRSVRETGGFFLELLQHSKPCELRGENQLAQSRIQAHRAR